MKQRGTNYFGEKGKLYFNRQSKGSDQRGQINSRKFQRYIKPNDIVLDFGCGTGTLLAKLDCKRRIGIEVNPYAIEVAKKNGIDVFENLHNIEPKSIDVIISNHALEHVLNPFVALCEVHEKLKNGGKLLLCLPIDDWRKQKQFNPNDRNHHLYTWTPLLIGNLLMEADYLIEKVWIYTHAWPPKRWQILDALLPVWLFDIICFFTAVKLKQRQLMAIAMKK